MSDQARYGVRVETSFEATHRCDPAGDTAKPHSHRWEVAVSVESNVLDRIAIVVDFRKLRADTEAILDEVRGTVLESHAVLGAEPTTPVAVGRWILERLSREYAGATYAVTAVEVACDPGVSFTVTP